MVGIAVATMVLSTAAMKVPIRHAASTSVRRASGTGSNRIGAASAAPPDAPARAALADAAVCADFMDAASGMDAAAGTATAFASLSAMFPPIAATLPRGGPPCHRPGG